ncbi:hypothetical protein RKE29_30510, partial [Streptomyces sp. B1866]|nr:hypothetical protein [Streptomyces sp. B1866]
TMQDTASPTSAFVRECCETGPACQVPVDELWAVWKDWADDSGIRPGTKQLLGRNLLSVVPQLRRSKPRGDDGERIAIYLGITLADGRRNGAGRGPSRTTGPDPALGRDGPRPNPLRPPLQQTALCAVCGTPYQPLEPGQTTHP